MNNKNGFHVLPKDQLSAISRKGGQQAHVLGRAHTFSPEEAKEAGRKGGMAAQAKRRAAKLQQSVGQEASPCLIIED